MNRVRVLVTVFCMVSAGAAIAEPAADAPPPPCGKGSADCPQMDITEAFVTSVVGAPAGPPRTGELLNRVTEEVARQLRCPVCQGSSIGDSPSSTARNMKDQVRQLLSVGYGEEQVLSYFEASYGEFVRLAPKTEGFTLLVWVLPALLVLGGALVVRSYFRSTKVASTVAPAANTPTTPATPDDPELEQWLQRARDLSGSGGPGSGGAST